MAEDRHVRREGTEREKERDPNNKDCQSRITTGCHPTTILAAVSVNLAK